MDKYEPVGLDSRFRIYRKLSKDEKRIWLAINRMILPREGVPKLAVVLDKLERMRRAKEPSI